MVLSFPYTQKFIVDGGRSSPDSQLEVSAKATNLAGTPRMRDEEFAFFLTYVHGMNDEPSFVRLTRTDRYDVVPLRGSDTFRLEDTALRIELAYLENGIDWYSSSGIPAFEKRRRDINASRHVISVVNRLTHSRSKKYETLREILKKVDVRFIPLGRGKKVR